MNYLITFFLLFFAAQNSWALPSFKKNSQASLPAILKADTIDGDKLTNVITANGNVEVSTDGSVIYADQLTYSKNDKTIRAIGNVKIKDFEIGNVRAKEAEVKDDFSSGMFTDSKIVFNDGSYLSSPKIDRKTPLVTVLKNPIYSICPSPEISLNNELAGKKRDMASIKSSSTVIDRDKQVMRSKHGIFRFYNIPVFYTPFIQTPLPAKERQTGFLHPSYAKSTSLGLGIRTPFYWNISPNKDLTINPFIGISSKQIILNNEFRHMTSYGEYRATLEIANNELISNTNTNTTVVKRSTKQYRGYVGGSGIFDFTTNSGLNFSGTTVFDRNYLRDYYFSYTNHTLSKINLDYIKGREYQAIKTIRIQELESVAGEKAAPWILPSIDSHIETKPFFFKEKFSLTSNATAITRQDGLQYRRTTFIPEANIPFNLRGNLFNINSKLQADFYSLDNNFQYGTARTNDFDHTQSNFKPEISFGWRLPLIKKSKSNTLMIEPMANFVVSSYRKNFNKLPNEDSNSSELTVSNLFVTDRISGFDRNEAGERASYGAKTSLFNKYGEFSLTAGQSYRKSNEAQDVVIRGFADNNKSNIVGQAMYKAMKYFSLSYSFQLNESNYRNDVNQVTAALTFDRFTFTTDYLLIRKSLQNVQEREQISATSMVKLTNRWKVTVSSSRDLVLDRTLSRGLTLYRDGCCTTFGFSVVETNPSSLVKPQKTFNLSLSFKNL
jgi:LPS-assembly protein